MNMAACPSHENLTAYALGKLPVEEMKQVARHTRDCRQCQGQLQELDSLADDLLVQIRHDSEAADASADAGPPDLIPRLEALDTGMGASTPGHGSVVGDGMPLEIALEAKQILAPPQEAGEIGRLGAYRVQKLLGAGGMGLVFQAEDPQLHRTVALKVMKPSAATQPTARERFLREAQATAQVRNDHVVTVYQVAEDREIPFLAMEFLEGETLESFLRRSGGTASQTTLTVDEILRIGHETAAGLAAAHERGLVHRDIKPSNIWLEKEGGRVKIVDFGLAQIAYQDQKLTQAGTVLGTPAYMAPEQANGRVTDARSDLFSLGCVLYQLCTGQAPFQGETTFDILLAVVHAEPPPIEDLNPRIPKSIAGFILRLLAKKPDDRPASAREVRDALLAMQRQRLLAGARPSVSAPTSNDVGIPAGSFSSPVILGVPPRRSRAGLWAGMAVAAVLGVAGPLLYLQYNQNNPAIVPSSANLPPTVVAVAPTPPATTAKTTPVTTAKTTPVTTAKVGPSPETEQDFNLRVSKLRGGLQIKEVDKRLKQLNPKFEGIGDNKVGFWYTKKKADETFGIHRVLFSSDAVSDISPLAALIELDNVAIAGSKPGLGKIVNLRPLKDLKLIKLDISNTQVQDLSPLQGMGPTLTYLNCSNTRVRDLSALSKLTELKELDCDLPLRHSDVLILRALTKLTKINGKAKVDSLPSPKKLQSFSTNRR